MTSVNLFPNEEQRLIVDSTRDVLRREFPLTDLHKADALKDVAARRWATAVALGWPGIGLPEDIGGAGFTVAEEVLLFRELGRSLVSPEVMASLLAAQSTARFDPSLASSFIAGHARAGIAFPATVPSSGAAGRLYLVEARRADYLVVLRADAVALHARDDIEHISEVESIDPMLWMATGELASSARPSVSSDAAELLLARAQLLIAAQLVGIAEATRDMAVEYAKVREQFGQPIGAFQAVAHHCVDMELRARAALTQTLFAAIAVRDVRPDGPFQASSALLVASDAAFRNATINIRIHGGMGYSAESSAHLFLKRTVVVREMLGGAPAAQSTILAQAAPL